MDTVLYLIAGALILTGLVGAVVPAVPGIPLIFAGIWLIARVDQYRHVGPWWLAGIALVGVVGLTIDLVAGALGAKRVGASQRAVWGALLGTLVGLFFGLPGLLLGPFFGAVLGEVAAGSSILRSTHVGASAWIGLIFGTMVKLVASVMMVALLGAGWWWNRL
ncbi:MAG: rane protein [Gammaproteobacteria bacterium]|nr:rane protein [Gammaproteobacteria bacterium]